jgi:3-oxoacyl-[acyl-carrier-protein] synthase-3
MRRSVIEATGVYLPESVVHNDDLNQFPASSHFLISQRTGVFARRRAGEKECTSDLAAKAAKSCLDRADVAAGEVEAIIVSTSSPDRMQPATAARTQHLLGAENAFAFDMNSVCSGSIYGLALADSLIRSGQCSNVLFIASEMYSKILNERDFSTYPYFGDGAGAVFLSCRDGDRGIMASMLHTDGKGSEVITVPGGGTMLPYSKIQSIAQASFRMKGKAVYEFAVSKGTEVILQLLERSEKTPGDIKCFICHQANVHIIAGIAQAAEIPLEQFYINLYRYGNMASASVPIALDEALSKKVVQKGDLVVTAAFGGGLSWGANLIAI